MVLVAVTSAPEGRLELLDAVGTSDGAAVAWRERGLARPSDVLRVRRVRDDGSHHDWSASGRGSLRAVATLANDAPLEFSMAWDAAVDRLAMLVGGATERGPCTFAAFGAGDGPHRRMVDVRRRRGFRHDDDVRIVRSMGVPDQLVESREVVVHIGHLQCRLDCGDSDGARHPSFLTHRLSVLDPTSGTHTGT